MDLENFATASVDHVVVRTHGRSSLLTTLSTVDTRWLNTHAVHRNAVTQLGLPRFVEVDLLYNLILQLFLSRQDFE